MYLRKNTCLRTSPIFSVDCLLVEDYLFVVIYYFSFFLQTGATSAWTSGVVPTWWRRIIAINRWIGSFMPWTTRPVRLNSVWISSPPCSLRSPNPTLNLVSCCTAWSSRRCIFGDVLTLGNRSRNADINSLIHTSVREHKCNHQWFRYSKWLFHHTWSYVLTWNMCSQVYWCVVTYMVNVMWRQRLCMVDAMVNISKF